MGKAWAAEPEATKNAQCKRKRAGELIASPLRSRWEGVDKPKLLEAGLGDLLSLTKLRERKSTMNIVKKMEAWKAADGSIHETERKAILASIEHIINQQKLGYGGDHGVSSINVRQIEAALPELMPLFTRLMDPRNREQPVRLATEEERAIPMEPIDTRTFEDMRDSGDMLVAAAPGEAINEALAPGDVDPGDLRVGQVVTFGDGLFEGIIREIDPEEKDGLCVFISYNINGAPPPDEFNAMVRYEEITAILKQPEDTMDLETAQDTLDRLEACMTEGGEATHDPLTHKRRILLNRRIEQLRSEANA